MWRKELCRPTCRMHPSCADLLWLSQQPPEPPHHMLPTGACKETLRTQTEGSSRAFGGTGLPPAAAPESFFGSQAPAWVLMEPPHQDHGGIDRAIVRACTH